MLAKIFIAYLIVMNILGFLFMGIDKKRARKDKERIPEANLFLIAVLGGSLGAIAGMWAYHHKTKKKRFLIGMPLLLLFQISLIVTFYVGFSTSAAKWW